MKALGLLVALAACGDNRNIPPDPDSAPLPSDGPLPDLPPPRETVTNTYTLAVGELAEAQMNGGPTDRAIIRISAPTPDVDWNIHSHPAGETINFYTEMNVMTTAYDFIPTEVTEWFLLVRNGGPTSMTVEVVVDLYGTMTYDNL
jgi:hypothetical protein